MGTGQGKLQQELVTDNALLKRKYESEELEGAEVVSGFPSGSGVVFDRVTGPISQAEYDAIVPHDERTAYFVADVGIYVGDTLIADAGGGGGGGTATAVAATSMTLKAAATAGRMLFTATTPDTAARLHVEPKGFPTGTQAKTDWMFDPYDSDPVNYRMANIYTKNFDAADASTQQGNNGIAVLGVKGVGDQWGVWPSLHVGFSDDGAAAATPFKMYYFDSSDSVWRQNVDGAWRAGRAITSGRYYLANQKLYQADASGTAGSTKPSHTSGSVSDGSLSFTFVRDFSASSGSVIGCVVIGNRDDLPKFGYSSVRAQFAQDVLFWSAKKLNFANESGGVSAYIYATTGLGSDEVRFEVATNKAMRINKTSEFFALVGMRRVLGAVTITDNSATPSVAGGEHFTLTNTAATNVTSFTNMLSNQIFTIEGGNTNTTLVHGPNLRLAGGVNKALTTDDVLMFKVSAAGTVAKQVA